MNAADLKQMSDSSLESYIAELTKDIALFEAMEIAPLMTVVNNHKNATKEWEARIGKRLFGSTWAKVGA